MNHMRKGGYTLVELIVAVGLFALIMTLASGAYLVMIGVARHTQAMSIGIDNLSFALETMTRTIRTGTAYVCNNNQSTRDCNGGYTFSVRTPGGAMVTYTLSGGAITEDGVALTDPSVTVSSLTFYTYGALTEAQGDTEQPRVVILASGTVSSGAEKTVSFSVETEATMRGSDI